MADDSLSAWDLEAIAFLERLQAASLSDGFVSEFRPTQSEMAWFATVTIHGRLGQFELRLWTTPALAGLEQARLTLLPNSQEAGETFAGTMMPVLQCEGIDGFGPLVEYLRAVVEHVDTKEKMLLGLGRGSDPRWRLQREAFVSYARSLRAPLKPKGGSS